MRAIAIIFLLSYFHIFQMVSRNLWMTPKSGAEQKQLEREMTGLKPVLLRLYRRRERCQHLLIHKEIMSQVELQELLREVTVNTEQEKFTSGNKAGINNRGNTEPQEYCISNNTITQTEEDEESHSDSCTEEVDVKVGKWEPDSWLISGKCDKHQAIGMLQSCPDGTFLIRSSSKPGYYALSVVCKNSVHHCLIEYQKGAGYGFEGTKVVFKDLAQFVRHYSSNSLGDHNQLLDTRLKYPVKKAAGGSK